MTRGAKKALEAKTLLEDKEEKDYDKNKGNKDIIFLCVRDADRSVADAWSHPD